MYGNAAGAAGRTARRSRRATALGVALVTAALGVTGCGGSSGSGDGGSGGSKRVRIALVGYASSNVYAQAMFRGMQAEARRSGAEVTMIDGKLDPRAQASAMQDAIQSRKYDTLVVLPNDATSLRPQVKAAAKAGLHVIAGDYTFAPPDEQGTLRQADPDIVSTIGAGRDEQAKQFVANIVAACAAKNGPTKPCKVGLMPGNRSVAFAAKTLKQISTDAAAAANVSSVVTPDGGFAKPTAYKSAITFLQNHKDVDVIWAQNDTMIEGVLQALKQNGLSPGKDVYVTGFGGTSEAVAGVRDGTWASSVGLFPQKEGALAVQQAAALAAGKKVPSTTSIYALPGARITVDKKTVADDPDFRGDWSANG